jgi:hypothetical protein
MGARGDFVAAPVSDFVFLLVTNAAGHPLRFDTLWRFSIARALTDVLAAVIVMPFVLWMRRWGSMRILRRTNHRRYGSQRLEFRQFGTPSKDSPKERTRTRSLGRRMFILRVSPPGVSRR